MKNLDVNNVTTSPVPLFFPPIGGLVFIFSSGNDERQQQIYPENPVNPV